MDTSEERPMTKRRWLFALTAGISDRHSIPGQGNIAWARFMKSLAATGYTGPLMLEVMAVDRHDELPRVLSECMASVRRLQKYLDCSNITGDCPADRVRH